MAEFGKIEEISEDIKRYVITNYEIVKLEATERTSVVGSNLLSSLIIGLVIFMFVLVLSLGIGFYLSALLGSSYIGFIMLAGFYLLVGIILTVTKKKILERPLRDKIIREICNKKQSE